MKTVGSGRTNALKGACVVTGGNIVAFQEGIIDMSGPIAQYTPFSMTNNLCIMMEPKDNLEAHAYEQAARMAGLRVATYLGEVGKDVEPDEVIAYETKPIREQIKEYHDLPTVAYVHMLQSQGLLHDTYYYGVDAKQMVPTLMYPTEIMDGAIISGNCVAPCDKVTTYHHLNNPVIEDLYKRHGKDLNFVGVILTNENVFLMDKERSSDVGADVVLITDEFPGRDGKSQSVADATKEADAVVSCGQGNLVVHFPAMDKIIGTLEYVEMMIGGYKGCLNEDGSMDAELQIIIASTIANGYNHLAARWY